jgi:uncharacterized protein involved in type VI secretion and phage assembly
MNTDIVGRLVERIEGRFYGKYRAIVVDANDPDKMGRLRLQVPGVLGSKVVTGWALPCVPYGGPNEGFFFIPEKDATVWVEFEAGNPEFPIWVGAFWCMPGGETEAPKINDPEGKEEKERQSPPTRKVIKTLKGHTIQFEDADGNEMIIVTDPIGKNRIVMNKDGVRIEARKGIELKTDGDISIEAANVKVKVSGSMDVS